LAYFARSSGLVEVVADEVRLHVDDELSRQRARALGGHAGLRRLRVADVEHPAEDVVHGQEGGGHPGAAREELAPVQAVTRAELVRELLDARLHARLLGRLRQRSELAVGDDLRRHRRRKRRDLRRRRPAHLLVAQVVGHGGLQEAGSVSCARRSVTMGADHLLRN
jgi:hypothetical protein